MAFKTIWKKIGNDWSIERTFTDFYADQIVKELNAKGGNYISLPKGKKPKTYEVRQ